MFNIFENLMNRNRNRTVIPPKTKIIEISRKREEERRVNHIKQTGAITSLLEETIKRGLENAGFWNFKSVEIDLEQWKKRNTISDYWYKNCFDEWIVPVFKNIESQGYSYLLKNNVLTIYIDAPPQDAASGEG
jgi:hypothetical protein